MIVGSDIKWYFNYSLYYENIILQTPSQVALLIGKAHLLVFEFYHFCQICPEFLILPKSP